MRFMLHYRGPLRSNGKPAHKEEIRLAFSGQLERLWHQHPLSDMPALLQPRSEGQFCALRQVDGVTHVALVTAEAFLSAELGISMLRPGLPGAILQGGDIDNRLKTLFDALTVPQANQLTGISRSRVKPIYCLLEDDQLISSVEVKTHQLLEAVEPSEVDVTIAVEVRITRTLFDNMSFA